MASYRFIQLAFLFFPLLFSVTRVYSANEDYERIELFSPFASALETLQKQIGYNFTSIGLLRRAMTHSSFSEENNKALSVLGTHMIETAVSFLSLEKDIDVSSKELNRQISEISKVNSSCSVDGKHLGLQKIIRVSPKTDPSNTGILCDAFRAIFGAIAIDTGMVDDAINLFWKVHVAHAAAVVSL